MSSAFDGLSAKQKACLRLVADGLTSKEIAPLVGLTHESVNTYVKTATRLIGAPNRSVAARMLLDFERLPKLELPSDGVADTEGVSQLATPDGKTGSARPTPRVRGALLAPPPLGGRIADISTREKIAAMFRAALFLAVVVAVLLLLIVGGLRLL